MDIRKEIKAHSKSVDKVILIWLFARYHLSSQWRFVAKCNWVQYGKLSHECHRCWVPTLEGICIYNALKDQS